MPVASWNAQGAKNPQFRGKFVFLSNKLKLDFCIIRTLDSSHFVIRTLGYPNFYVIPPVNHSGGI